jgi:hypothetical protein
MTKAAVYKINLECPQCMRQGEAEGWEATGSKTHTFELRHLPPGFIVVAPGASLPEIEFQCECGCQFHA